MPTNGSVYVYSQQANHVADGRMAGHRLLSRCIVFAHRRMDDVDQRKQCQCHQHHGERDLEHGGDFGFSSEVRAHSGAYGNSTALAADRATAHSVAVNGLSAGTSYYLRGNRATQTGFCNKLPPHHFHFRICR